MTLRDLDKPAWDAALNAARCLELGNVNNPADRARFRHAKQQFANLLPNECEASRLILEAVHWDARNFIAAELEGEMV